MRARLALAASGINCALREVVLRAKPPALLQVSPKGTVPVLVLPDGLVLEQSLDIMLWALRSNDAHQWLPKTPQALDAALRLITACDGDFKHNLDRYKYPNRYDLSEGQCHRGAGGEFLLELNSSLATHRYLGGASFGLADAAIAPFVRQFAHTDPAWFACQPWSDLQQWLQNFEASIDYACAMEKYATWTEDQALHLFPRR
jgi:glutathione S-transferase